MDGVVTAIVKENWNPDAPGRLRAEYRYGEEGLCLTGWIPVASAYAGAGYGFYAMPEIGTEVLLAFIHGRQECPVVMGCLWNQINSLPEGTADEENTKKLFRTKTGYEISAEEEKKELVISDPQRENMITFRSEEGCISLDVKTRLELKIDGEAFLTVEKGKAVIAGDLLFQLAALTVEPGKGLTVKGESVELKPSQGVVISGQSVELKPSQSVTISPSQGVELKGSKVTLSPAQGVEIKSQQVTVDGTMVEIKAKASGKIESGGMLAVKGGMLMLN